MNFLIPDDMPDKLTDSEIVKALECCILSDCSRNCPLYYTTLSYRQCREATRKNALDLINRLQAELEKFKKRQKPTGASGYKIENGKVVFFTNMLGGYREEKENLEEVVKTMNELLQYCYSKDEIVFALKCKTEELKTAKAEAYKKVFEKLKDKSIMCKVKLYGKGKLFPCLSAVTLHDIKLLEKEMVGDDNPHNIDK